jgi:hypothetical protein
MAFKNGNKYVVLNEVWHKKYSWAKNINKRASPPISSDIFILLRICKSIARKCNESVNASHSNCSALLFYSIKNMALFKCVGIGILWDIPKLAI